MIEYIICKDLKDLNLRANDPHSNLKVIDPINLLVCVTTYALHNEAAPLSLCNFDEKNFSRLSPTEIIKIMLNDIGSDSRPDNVDRQFVALLRDALVSGEETASIILDKAGAAFFHMMAKPHVFYIAEYFFEKHTDENTISLGLRLKKESK